MVKFFSKSELDSLKSDNKNSHNAGEIYPQIFSHDEGLKFSENITLGAGIIWLGSYTLDNHLFPREKCPICGKEEVLIPYKTIGSVLSGCHTINFYCKNCGEKFVFQFVAPKPDDTCAKIHIFTKLKIFIMREDLRVDFSCGV